MLFITNATSFSNQTITDFKIGFMIDKVYLKWKSQIETSVKEYVIERSYDNISFSEIGKMPKKGSFLEYIYIDKNIFKASANTFYYRVKLLNSDETFFYSKVLQITPRVSSAKQTWGSIKAIFH